MFLLGAGATHRGYIHRGDGASHGFSTSPSRKFLALADERMSRLAACGSAARREVGRSDTFQDHLCGVLPKRMTYVAPLRFTCSDTADAADAGKGTCAGRHEFWGTIPGEQGHHHVDVPRADGQVPRAADGWDGLRSAGSRRPMPLPCLAAGSCSVIPLLCVASVDSTRRHQGRSNGRSHESRAAAVWPFATNTTHGFLGIFSP